MAQTRFLKRILTLISFCTAVAAPAYSQITNVTNTTSTPIPGAGHDYIKMLSETVNPANGSVSLRIQLPTPPGRKISLPFSIAYDSGGALHVMSDVGGQVVWADNAAYLSSGGWSYTVPMVSNTRVTEALAGGFHGTCTYDSNYVFQDATGGRHSLYLSIDVNTPLTCQNGTPIIPIQVFTAGDDYFSAALTTNSAPLLVADADGTVYSVSNGTQLNHQGGVDNAYSSLVSSIEDRNGNVMTLSDLNSQHAGSFSVTDTLGRTLLSTSGFGGATDTINVLGFPNSYTATWGRNTANQAVGSVLLHSDGFGCNLIPNLTAGGGIKQITLPNNQSYTLTYDPNYGLLSKITYPDGGFVSYTWTMNTLSEYANLLDENGAPNGCEWHHDTPAVAQRSVSFDGVNIALQQNFSYSTTWNGTPTWSSKTTTVTTTDNITGLAFTNVYTYSPFLAPRQPNDYSPHPPQIPLEQTVVYKNSSGTTLRTVNKTWLDQYELASEQTTLEDGTTSSKTTYTYGPRAQVTSKSDFDFPSGTALIRKTVTNYQGSSATPIYPGGASIFDKPCQTIIYDSTGTNRVAESDYFYDGSASTTPCSAATTQTLPGSGSYTGHDETHYGTTASVTRGNLTKMINQCFQGATACANGDSKTTYAFDETGQLTSMTDPCGNTTCADMTGTNHTTTYSYVDSYTVLSGGINVSFTPTGNTNAFLTKITDPLTHTRNFTYDFNNSQLTISKDQNALITTYLYNDPFARPTLTTRPDGGTTTVAYNDAALTATTSAKITSTQTLTTVAVHDGVGHATQSQLTSDPQGTVFTDATYDGLGGAYTASNPYRSTGEPTYGITTYSYDAIGRVIQVIPPDGTTSVDNVTTAYSGNCTTVTDQAGKARKTCSDALGRLTQIFEDPGSSPHLNYETDYAYDPLGNLLTVNQKGNDPNSADWRTRTFTYNSLSELLTAANPESGTISYTYDNDGNLSTKTAPKPNQTGSLTVVTTDSYDAVNRPTQKSYNDGTTPTVKYGYDGLAPSGCTPPTLTIGNPIGRRTSMCDAGGASAWSLDLTGGTGWKTTEARTTNAIPKNTIYQNNFGGSVATLTNPSSRIITYTLQSSGTTTAGRMLSAVDTANSINYATAATYAPTGALSSLTNGASLVISNYYDKRLQPCRISAKSSGTAANSCTDAANIGNVLDFTYNFNLGVSDNGNVAGITNNRNTTRSPSFTYDALNRLSTAKTSSTSGTTCWDEQFGFDPWANLLTIGRISGYSCSNEELLNFTATTKNQVSGNTYDSAGNLINDGLGHAYTFNAENQLTCAASTTYLYDGDGKRVEKATGCTTPVPTKLYWYGSDSDPLTETDASGNPTADYTFFNGKRTARIDLPSAVVHYYFADHLGSANVVTSSAGLIQDESDYYPFGGERAITNSDPNNYKFTGKERDAESGFDYFGARYYASNMGRWMSPDWADKPEAVPYSSLDNPQSLNLYGYVGNNPLSRADADGHYFVVVNSHDQKFYQNALRDLYRRPGGRELVKSLANSDRPVLLDRRSLDTAKTGTAGVTNALTLSGQPGVAGARVTMGTDADLMAGSKMAPGKVSSDVTTGHELEHANDGITAGQNSLQAGAAAMAAGDAPSAPGANNTIGGTAQARAEAIMGEKTDMNKKDATSTVKGMLKSGQQQWKDKANKPQ